MQDDFAVLVVVVVAFCSAVSWSAWESFIAVFVHTKWNWTADYVSLYMFLVFLVATVSVMTLLKYLGRRKRVDDRFVYAFMIQNNFPIPNFVFYVASSIIVKTSKSFQNLDMVQVGNKL